MVVIEGLKFFRLWFDWLEEVGPTEYLLLFVGTGRIVNRGCEGAVTVVLAILRSVECADYCKDFSESELPELSEVTNVGPPEGGEIDPFIGWVSPFVGRYFSFAARTVSLPR